MTPNLLLIILLLSLAFSHNQQPVTVTVQVDRPGAAIAPTMFGLFFEDINFAADGGLYPERIKNRSFEFVEPMMGWKRADRGGPKGSLQIYDLGSELARPNSHYLRIRAESAGFGLTNEGFRGIGVEKGAEYTFSIQARAVGGTNTAPKLKVELEDADNRKLAEASVGDLSEDWKQYRAVVRATDTAYKAHLNILLDSPGSVDIDLISFYPKNTWKGRANGLRTDLAKLLSEIKPGFLRFPGGCIVEGRHLETRYQWKTTIGDVADRRLIINRWNTEFRHKPAPDYFQSFGLGYFEYFLLSEDIGAEPLPILNCGMACQFNSAELVPLDQLDHFIKDALDLIEFANGAVTTEWGRKRAQMGHPAPFNLKMIGIGNEQWGPQYVERYELFAKELKAKHPEIRLISSAGPAAGDERFHYLWGKMRELKADLVDEHYYMPPKWFLENSRRYDSYPRTGPKVFAGEYAAQSVGVARPENRNNWECALAEAAFITGLERNADVVVMSSYAPLFGHVEAWQWTPNLIWFDNLRSFGTPSYYIQKMYATNRGSRVLPVESASQGIYASASLADRTGEVILKLVNSDSIHKEVRIVLAGASRVAQSGRAIILASSDLKAENTLEEPSKVAPVEQPFAAGSSEFVSKLAPTSFTVLRIQIQ
jgi:alpha-L-arabinofuranosidase